MHGLGNDFIIIDQYLSKKSPHTLTAKLIQKLCDRHFGIGADQLLVLKKSSQKKADFRMDVWNADGTQAEMCGNGIRAVALYVAKRSKKPQSVYQVETGAGVLEVLIKKNLVRVDMGVPHLNPSKKDEMIVIGPKTLRIVEVHLGNPHAVIFVDSLEQTPVTSWGPQVENHPRFPGRTNVEFAQIQSQDRIEAKVWERGAGLTLACGTGACAIAVAALATRRVSSDRIAVDLPGGRLWLSWKGSGQSVFMEGPAEEVFSGEILI